MWLKKKNICKKKYFTDDVSKTGSCSNLKFFFFNRNIIECECSF